MAKYDNEMLIDLCSKVDLFEYVQNSYDFEKRGQDSFATHCPLHTDNTPSLFVTPSKNLWFCQSCRKGGNIINWLMVFENLKFNDSVDKVAKLAGVDIKNLKQCEALSFYKTMKRLTNIQEKQEPNERIILPEDSILQFKDESPQEWIDEGIKPEIMKRYNVRIDENANRIVYPVYDADFNLIGFKGRTRYENYKLMKIKKYQNYQKIGTTDFFIGMKENIESITAHETIILFEGIKSGMKVEAWGYDFWAASETGWLNEYQVAILIKMKIKNVVIAYDNDVDIAKIIECTAMLRKFTNVYAVLDRKSKNEKLLGSREDKMSPCDKGREVWDTLYRERVRIG